MIELRCYDIYDWEALSGDQLPRLRQLEAVSEDMVIGRVKLADRPICEQDLRELYPTTPMLYQLYVEKSMRSQRIGSMLMDALERLAIDEGFRQQLLCVKPDNIVARAMYEKRGYTYIRPGGKELVKSVWHLKNSEGERVHVVELLPMIKYYPNASEQPNEVTNDG